MKLLIRLWLLVCVAITSANAQDSAQPPADAIRVFLDCSYYCDSNFIRTEINYVNWVRDRADAQVHVLVSRQGTGGGGQRYTFTFTGLKEFASREDTLSYTSRTTDSEDAVRRGITHTLKLGLVPFIATTSSAERLQISWSAPAVTAAAASAAPAADPWNYWVFTVSARSNFQGEESQKFQYLNGNLSANRTTDQFKIRVSLNGSYDESGFTYADDDGTDITTISIRKNYSLNLLSVKSLGSHWSAGLQGGASSATFGNTSLGLNAGPAIEYSFWPYIEANRRSAVLRYSVGVRSFDYREITIYDKLKETHPTHSLTAELDLKQRWGSTNFEVAVAQYLHDPSKYNARLWANANLRLFKGFSMDFYGSYTRVRDQLSLSAANLTPEQVLLRQRELETGYRYFGGIGVRYSFGSIFNNVVNPRFGEGGGSIIIMN